MKTTTGIMGLVCWVIFVFGGNVFAGAPVAVSLEDGMEEGLREVETQGLTVAPLALEGTSNTLYGNGAGQNLGDDDDFATFIGYQAGYNTNDLSGAWEGKNNTFVGYQAGYTNTTGNGSTFLGYQAGYSNTGGSGTFVGVQAGYSNTTGLGNTFIGGGAGYYNTDGNDNTFLGNMAGRSNIIGDGNAFFGAGAGYNNAAGNQNIFVGMYAGQFNTTGNYNVYVGGSAGAMSTGNSNVFLGWGAGANETGSNKLYIDKSVTSTPLIYGEFDNRRLTVNGNLEVIGPDNGLVRLSNVVTNSTNKVARMVVRHYNNAEEPVYLFGAASTASDNFVALGGGATIGNAATQLDLFTAANTTTPVGTARITVKGNGYVGIGTQTPSAPLQMAGGAYTNGTGWFNASSREYKENIESLDSREALMTLASLDPVKFNYKTDASEKHVGFIAEDVPDLVATKDRKGLSAMDIVAVLTKVVQEQQRRLQDQQRVMQDQQRLIDGLMKKMADLEMELR